MFYVVPLEENKIGCYGSICTLGAIAGSRGSEKYGHGLRLVHDMLPTGERPGWIQR